MWDRARDELKAQLHKSFRLDREEQRRKTIIGVQYQEVGFKKQ